MLATIGTVENFIITPSPILDDSEQGYHLEQHLQVTLRSAIDEQPLTIEFRLGDGAAAPSEQVLATWLVEDELVAAICTGISTRPLTPRQRREVQGEEPSARPDTVVVLAGQSMVALSEGIDLREAVKTVRVAYKRAQRDYLLRRNAERVEQVRAHLPERVEQLKRRQGAQAADSASAAAETSPHDVRRGVDRAEQLRAQLPERIRLFTERRGAPEADAGSFTASDTSPNGRVR